MKWFGAELNADQAWYAFQKSAVVGVTLGLFIVLLETLVLWVLNPLFPLPGQVTASEEFNFAAAYHLGRVVFYIVASYIAAKFFLLRMLFINGKKTKFYAVVETKKLNIYQRHWFLHCAALLVICQIIRTFFGVDFSGGTVFITFLVTGELLCFMLGQEQQN